MSPLKKGHVLKGFDVTLVKGKFDFSIEEYQEIQDEIEKSDHVIFTSILYKTNDGGLGGDLPQLYYKVKKGETFNHMSHFNVKYGERYPQNSFFYYPYDQRQEHYFLDGVYVSTYTKKNGDIRTHQKEMLASGKFEFVSVNTLHTILATTDDPYFENQWALKNEGSTLHYDGTPGADISVVSAWDITTGDPLLKIENDSNQNTRFFLKYIAF
ncbi:MAG: hypothetical protein P8I55_02340 [Crocinitomix sp.]|nr:hypothetical protein [Crocinitomix sp.]